MLSSLARLVMASIGRLAVVGPATFHTLAGGLPPWCSKMVYLMYSMVYNTCRPKGMV